MQLMQVCQSTTGIHDAGRSSIRATSAVARRVSRPGLLLMLCGSLWCGRAAAQDEIDAARKAKVNFNGVYVTPTLQLKELGIDSNVFNRNGEQTPDFTTTLSPGADLALPFAHRVLVTSHVDMDFVYYAQYANQRSINPNVSVGAKGFLRRVTLFADGHYLNSRQRLNQEIDARARRLDKSAGAGIDVKIFPKISTSVSARSGRVDYADAQVFRDVDLRQSLAEDLSSATAAISFKATPLTTFVLRGQAQRDRFLFSPFKSSDSYRLTPGVEFKPRALISGSAYIGFGRFTPQNALVPRFSGAVAALSLRYVLRSATALTATADRDVQYSYLEIEPYFVSTSAGLLLRRQLAGAFDATVGAQRFNYAYRDLLPAGLNPAAPRVDITYNLSSDVGYRLSRKARLGVGVSYWTRTSNKASEVGYSGFRFGSTLSYGV